MKIPALFLIFLSLASVLAAETIRIASYNVKNYLVTDRLVEGRWRPAYPKPELEKAAVRESILAVRPDILVLQEMGGLPFLEELREDLARLGLHYPYAVLMQGADEERRVAVLSLLPPQEVVKHGDLDFKYFDRRELVKRGLLEMSFEGPDGERFQLFAVHLKSRWTDEPKDPESAMRRTREAEACRNRVVERTLDLDPAARFLVVGDFNDHPRSAALRRFQQRGDLTIGQRVPAADASGLFWTHFYEKQSSYSTVDGFVLSESLLPLVRDGAGTVHGDAAAMRGSDHRLVYIDLEAGAEVSADGP